MLEDAGDSEELRLDVPVGGVRSVRLSRSKRQASGEGEFLFEAAGEMEEVILAFGVRAVSKEEKTVRMRLALPGLAPPPFDDTETLATFAVKGGLTEGFDMVSPRNFRFGIRAASQQLVEVH